MPASEERAGFTLPLAPSPEATAFLAQMLASAPALLTIDTLPHHRQTRAVAYQPRIDRALLRYPSRCMRSVRSGVECVEVESEKGAHAGTLLYCYGGGFVCGFPEQDMPIIAALACFTGMRIVVPHYRLAPEHPWPAALDDVCRVFQDLSRAHPRGSLALVGNQQAAIWPWRWYNA
jgi:acetyl esterase/lipase